MKLERKAQTHSIHAQIKIMQIFIFTANALNPLCFAVLYPSFVRKLQIHIYLCLELPLLFMHISLLEKRIICSYPANCWFVLMKSFPAALYRPLAGANVASTASYLFCVFPSREAFGTRLNILYMYLPFEKLKQVLTVIAFGNWIIFLLQTC